MMGACQVLHVNHIDREPMQMLAGLENSSIAKASRLSVAQPPLLDTLDARRFEILIGLCMNSEVIIEPSTHLCSQGLAVYFFRDAGDLGLKEALRSADLV